MKDFLMAHFDLVLVFILLLCILHSAVMGNTWSQGEVHGLTEALLTMVMGAGARAAMKKDKPDA